MNRGEEVGVLLLGLAALSMGYRTIRRREEVAIDEIGKVIATWRGPAAVCQGLGVALAGVGIAAFAAVGLLGVGSSLEAHLRQRPGILILFCSLAGLTWSLSLVFGSVEQGGSTRRRLAGLPGRLLGVFLSMLATAGLGVGAWELVAPAGFDHVMHSIAPPSAATRTR
jgi:hypothetical protein